jgi:hypothetical protein
VCTSIHLQNWLKCKKASAEARRAIHDYAMKEHNNQEITDQLWDLFSYY